ncbi:MAG: YtxH domain-containing protein [Prolixibacteraceae bacterium]|nr:YtxH domain-containing protein [Prolixibacteraceae bacterium]
MNSGKVLLSVVAGAAAGALVGILFAPHRGSVTRKKIARQSGAYAEGVKEKLSEIVDSITEKLEKVKGEVSDYADQKMHKTENLK